MNDPQILPAFTIEEDGSISQGAQVELFTTKRQEDVPVISVGEQTKGGWLAFVFIDLTRETDKRLDDEDVTVTAVSVHDLELSGGRTNRGREFRCKFAEEAVSKPELVSGEQAIIVIRRRITPMESWLPGNDEIFAIGRIAGPVPEGDDNGKQIIVRVTANKPVLLSLRGGGYEGYVFRDGALRFMGTLN